MPTYEYQCASCSVAYELRQGFDAEITHTCEECGKGVAKRILHAPRVVFKGSGWYATDSKKSASSVTESPDSGGGGADAAAEPAAASTETKTEPSAKKPASEAKSKPSDSNASAAAAG